MACNGKRDQFSLEDLIAAAKSADVKRPRDIIADVERTISGWPEFTDLAGIHEKHAVNIGRLHRRFTGERQGNS